MALSFGKIGTIRIQTCLMLAYFLAAPIYSVATGVFGELPATLLVNFTIAFFLVLTAYEKAAWKWFFPILIYSCIAVVILSTILIHPDYRDWYFHERYGIVRSFVDLRSGVVALCIFSLYDNEEELVEDLKVSAIMVFIAYFYKFLLAMRRGYWLVGSGNGKYVHAAYDMEYGYRTLFTAAFFGASGFINKNYRHITFYLLCVLLILIGGSRGSAIWAVFVIPVACLYRYFSLPLKKKRIVLSLTLVSVILFIAIYCERAFFAEVLMTTLDTIGIHSRTIDAVMSGSIASANGRDIIYGMAIDLIKSGGPFGHGFYGDRLVIGRRFIWGYSHNIFLELFVQFGYLGGALISALLVWNVIRLFRNCRQDNRQIIFVTVLIGSMRLLVSNSFWYEPWFWAMVSLFFWFNKSNVKPISTD